MDDKGYADLVAWYRQCTPPARAGTLELFRPEDKNLVVSVESGVATVVKTLNNLGWKTMASCEGHGLKAMAYVTFLARRDQIDAWSKKVFWPVYFDRRPFIGLGMTPYSEAVSWVDQDPPVQFMAMSEAIFGDKDLIPVNLAWGDLPWTYLIREGKVRKPTLGDLIKRVLYFIVPRAVSVHLAKAMAISVGKS